VVIRPDKTILEYESHAPYPAMLEDKLFVAGSGGEGALVAMLLGATAEEAVAVVCKVNLQCGNGITVLQLKEPKKGRVKK